MSLGTLLDSDANLLLLGDGSLICNNCTYSCNACGNKIEDLAILTGDQAFCSACFRCRNCKKKIENLRYARTSQGIFCMSCHEALMARRRKRTKPKGATNGSISTKEKALPSLPPGAVSQAAFTPDTETPGSEVVPAARSPPERQYQSRADTGSTSIKREVSPLAEDASRGRFTSTRWLNNQPWLIRPQMVLPYQHLPTSIRNLRFLANLMTAKSSVFFPWHSIPTLSPHHHRSKGKSSHVMTRHRQRRLTAEVETTLEAASNLTEISCGKRGPVRQEMPQLSGSQADQAIRSSRAHISGIKRKDGKRSERALAHLRQALHSHRHRWEVFRRRAIVPYRNSWRLAPVHRVKATDSSYKKCQRRRKIEPVAARKQRRGRLQMSRRLKPKSRCLNRQNEWNPQALT